jgi:hypothetical protein
LSVVDVRIDIVNTKSTTRRQDNGLMIDVNSIQCEIRMPHIRDASLLPIFDSSNVLIHSS